MRRLALFGVVGMAVTACDFDSPTFDYQSTLYQRTNGVVLRGYDEATWTDRAQVGMVGTTCQVDIAWASLGSDYDWDMADEETVTDAGTTDGKPVVAGITRDTLHLQTDDDAWWATTESHDIPGVQDALVTNDGAVAFYDTAGGCGVRWVGLTDASRSVECGSGGSLAANPLTGEAFLGSDVGITRVTPSAQETITEQPSELVAWDATAQVLYAATIGGSVLRGLEADGTERFATDVGARILGVDDLGTRGAAIVTVEQFAGGGGIVVVDGTSGLVEASQTTPSAVAEVKGSLDGNTFALVDTDAVHFYRLGTFGGPSTDADEGGMGPILGF